MGLALIELDREGDGEEVNVEDTLMDGDTLALFVAVSLAVWDDD